MIVGILIAGILNFEWSTDTINNIWERYRFNVFSCRSHFGLGHNKCTTCPSVSNGYFEIYHCIVSTEQNNLGDGLIHCALITNRLINPGKSTLSSSRMIVMSERTAAAADLPPSVKTGFTQFTQVLQLSWM